MKPHSENFIRKRRFFMVLPLLVTPFITMAFWAMGGGKGTPTKTESPTQGLNASLPDAHFSNKETWDKLNLYEMAKRDSNKFEEARENDPYFDLITFKTQKDKNSLDSSTGKLINAFPHKDKLGLDPNEERVNKKLEELFREVNKSAESQNDPSAPKRSSGFTSSSQRDPQFTQDVDRLGQMMEMMKDSPEADPEMQQIESVLEKILDIQHPDRVEEKLQAFSDKQKANALPVTTAEADDNIALLGAHENPSVMTMDTTAFLELLSLQSTSNGFFGLDDEVTDDEGIANGIRAVIHDTQELVDGATVKMRLVDAVNIQGRNISAGQFLFGTCAINGERLTIEINSVRDGNALMPVALSVFDLDGLEGIYIPGAITRDAAKQASGNALQNVQLMSLDPSIGAQAAAAGVEAAKGLLGNKAKLIKVTVKAGYQILLKDNNPATR
jgi:conjugative transposon TraM protein